jgi:hypothetical protein
MYVGVDEDKKSFTLLHCWRRLKDEDKWKSKMIELAEQQKLATKKKATMMIYKRLQPQQVKNGRGQWVRRRQKNLGGGPTMLAL